ncbi:MAG: S41 family peptidase, partial [Chloroflexota bacterium]
MTDGYYRYPTIHKDTIVFVSEDDLWTVPSDGGIARRLTANLGEISWPSLSPDGNQLAFIGREEGESEVYCMPSIGGEARRLTFLGARTLVSGWVPNSNKILFASNTSQPFAKRFDLYSLASDSVHPEKLATGPAVSISYQGQTANQGCVIGRNTTDLARWKRYRGGTTGDLWIDREGNQDWQRLVALDGNVALPRWVGERIYFVSDHEGIGNLYSCTPSGEDIQRHTDHDDYYVRHISTDQQQIVYHAGADIYRFDPESNKSTQVEISYYSPRIQRNRKFVDTEDYLEDYDLHPEGYAVSITSRGKPFVMANWERAAIQQGQLHGVRYRLATWLKDGKRLVMVSDADGEEALELHQADASALPERLADLDVGRVEVITAAPWSNKIALANHRQELLIVDCDEKTVQRLDHNPYRPLYDFCWSPDERWLAYSYANSNQTSIIKLCLIETGETWEVTRTVLRDISPSFDPEGRYLYFLSYRDFDPVRDNLHFELSFPWGMRPYLITLQSELQSPFLAVPRPPGEKIPVPNKPEIEEETDETEVGDEDTQQDASAVDASEPSEDEASVSAKATDNNDADDETQEDKPIEFRIDLEGIQDRIIAFPVSEGRYGKIQGIHGKVLYSSYPLTRTRGRSWASNAAPSAHGNIELYDLENQSHETLQRGITTFYVTPDCKHLIYQARNELRVLKAGDKPDDSGGYPSRKTGWLDLDRIKVLVEPPDEWQQMFRDAWRLQRDFFWTEDMSAIDWETVYQRYISLVDRLGSRAEFSDLMWEMQGELGTSHAYEFGGDYRPDPGYYQGYLGVDIRYDTETDRYLLEKIIQGDVWDRRTSSPLARPGYNLKPGDQLVAINRRKLGDRQTPHMMLVNQAREEVLLTFQRDDEEEPWSISIATLFDESEARYRQWVDENRKQVHDLTDGRVGYIHIPDMGSDGFAEFHRGFLAELDREGLIVDVRFNGGGNVSTLLLEKLARKRLGYDISRWGSPTPYPWQAPYGQMVALINEHAGSDGDIFSHAFKLMELGPLIGTRTWGGVIGITVNDHLIDGGLTTQPQFSTWFQDIGWRLENYGTDPDIEVEIRPQDYVANEDPQLDKGIEVILAQLAENP